MADNTTYMADLYNTSQTTSGNVTTVLPPTESAYDKELPILMHFVCLGIIIPLGLVLNTMSFVVFATSATLRKTTTGRYLLALAVADTLFLIGEFIKWLNSPTYLGVSFLSHVNWACKFNFFLRYGAKLASAWITVAITIERFVTVAYPLKVAGISTPLIAKIVIVSLFAGSFLSATFVFWTVGVFQGTKRMGCFILSDMKHTYNVCNWVFLRVGSLFLPGTIILVLSVLIIHFLVRAQHIRNRQLSNKDCTATTSGGGSVKKQARTIERQLTMMLLAVTTAFMVLRLPYTIAYYIYVYKLKIFHPLTDKIKYDAFFAMKMTDVLVSVNYAINFFLYCWCGSSFRKQLLALSGCQHNNCGDKKHNSRITASSTLSSRNGSLTSNYGNQIELKNNGAKSVRYVLADRK